MHQITVITSVIQYLEIINKVFMPIFNDKFFVRGCDLRTSLLYDIEWIHGAFAALLLIASSTSL